ncbi:hypothetical protein EFW57_01143 [Bacillus velezensis]|nr:hypothetical protein EFW57_01143 [Bacillus velezensis]
MRLLPFSIQILPIQLFQSSGCPELGPAMAGATRHFCASLRCSLSRVYIANRRSSFPSLFKKTSEK